MTHDRFNDDNGNARGEGLTRRGFLGAGTLGARPWPVPRRWVAWR